MTCMPAADLRFHTPAMQQALQMAKDNTAIADLLFLEAWERDRPMHLAIMLRARQIRRANPQLSNAIAAGLVKRPTRTGA